MRLCASRRVVVVLTDACVALALGSVRHLSRVRESGCRRERHGIMLCVMAALRVQRESVVRCCWVGRMLDFGVALPKMRTQAQAHMQAGPHSRERVLAIVV